MKEIEKADIGLIGLATMGQNLVLNMVDHGFMVSVFNRTIETTKKFLKVNSQKNLILGFEKLEDFVLSLKRPKKILLMIQAGNPVDVCINSLLPFLSPGDIIIDGGNSHYLDTEKRCEDLKSKGFFFIGAGISGGEKGARIGPSIMPGGDYNAWSFVEKIFTSISAKSSEGSPCCKWIGKGGSGHYVKMVHNGIEYGDMQIIAEIYDFIRNIMELPLEEMGDVFEDWNKKELGSYLIEITSNILRYKDSNQDFLLDNILDVASQKGTGLWVGQSALELGVDLSLIVESVFSRYISKKKEDRVRASKEFEVLNQKKTSLNEKKDKVLEHCFLALYAAKIVSYTQGFLLLQEASNAFSWELNYSEIALLWREGCIIRSSFLNKISDAYYKNKTLSSLFFDDFFNKELKRCYESWKFVIITALEQGLPVPCLSAGLSFFNGYKRANSPANLIQALRDYFGAHTYERVDSPRGEYFHTLWEK